MMSPLNIDINLLHNKNINNDSFPTFIKFNMYIENFNYYLLLFLKFTLLSYYGDSPNLKQANLEV